MLYNNLFKNPFNYLSLLDQSKNLLTSQMTQEPLDQGMKAMTFSLWFSPELYTQKYIDCEMEVPFSCNS